MADTGEDLTEQTINLRAAAGALAKAEAPAHLLLVLTDNAPPWHVPLRSLPLTIGRSAPSELILRGGTVSRRHCRIEQQEDRIVLSDLGSTNCTFVDGERVTTSAVLQDGARITIGAHALSYHCRSQQELEDDFSALALRFV